MTDQPYISVIVTAYNRRRYLPFALKSLEAQTLPKDKFEVIVVKNFEDKESDSIISRSGWRSVYSDESYQGRFYLAGLEEASGEVVTFLDDDDVYVPERLEAIYKAFTSYDRLVYFHNSWAVIDENGNVLERPPLPTPKNLVGGSPIIVDVDRLRRLAKRYNVSVIDLTLKVRAGAWYNSSSLAVRRGVLEADAHLLRELPNIFDAFALASSLRAGGLLYLTDEKLTLYRVHRENRSLSLMSVAEGSKEETRLRRAGYLLPAISSCRLIGSRLLNDETDICLCTEENYRRALLTLPLPELGTLPPELRINISDVKSALKCYKIGHYKRLADLAFVMGHLFLSPILASPRGRLVVGKLLENIRRQS